MEFLTFFRSYKANTSLQYTDIREPSTSLASCLQLEFHRRASKPPHYTPGGNTYPIITVKDTIFHSGIFSNNSQLDSHTLHSLKSLLSRITHSLSTFCQILVIPHFENVLARLLGTYMYDKKISLMLCP